MLLGFDMGLNGVVWLHSDAKGKVKPNEITCPILFANIYFLNFAIVTNYKYNLGILGT